MNAVATSLLSRYNGGVRCWKHRTNPNRFTGATVTPQQENTLCVCGEPRCTIPYGLCHCGCGAKTRIARQSVTARGYIKGTPRRFAEAHSTKRPINRQRLFVDIDSQRCALILLALGKYAIVDLCDYEWLSQWTWSATVRRGGGKVYAVLSSVRGRRKAAMSRMILGLSMGDPRMADHINGDTLDNRRRNLRIASNSENLMNRGAPVSNTSGYKGVTFKRDCGRWAARITANKRESHLGYFANPEDAARAYNRAAKELHGQFARLNEVPA